MSPDQALTLLQDAVITVITVALPILLVSLVLGLIVSIFQATTQINEQTLAFVPKIVGAFLALVILGPWMLQQLQDLFIRMFEYTHVVWLLEPSLTALI